MKNIDIIPLSIETKQRISKKVEKLRDSSICIDIVSFKGNRLIVRTEQKECKNHQQFDKKHLEKIVRNIFVDEIPPEWKLTISAVDFNRSEIDYVNAQWVQLKMDEHNLKTKNLSTYTGIDKNELNNLLKDEIEFAEWQRIAFYYFFKYKEVSKFKAEL